MLLKIMLGLVALAPVTAIAWAHQETSPRDFATEDVRKRAIRPTTPLAGSGFEDFKGLGEIVGDARIVSLGEPTHGTHECFQMKHRLLEYLVDEKGFSIFSIEASMPEAYALSEYVIHGEGDPKELIAGMYFWTWNTQEVLEMVEWMRGWNVRNPPESGKPRLQFTGFDMQTPDVAWKIAGDFIAAHAPELVEAHAPLLRDVQALAASASMGQVTHGWTSMTGSFPADAAKGKKLTFSVWIKTQGVDGWAGGWWRCDTPAGVNGFNNMQEKDIKGDTDWTRHEFSLDVPADTNNVNFGFILSGGGTAWFDDIEVFLDGVKFEDPAKFSFDFENDAVKFLSGGSGEYAIKRSKDQARSGKQSLEIRRRPEAEVPKVDPGDVRDRTRKLYEDLRSRREQLMQVRDAKSVDWAIQKARVVSQCAAMFASDNGFEVRDESMADNVRWILDQNPGEKIVLWAHNGHMSRGGMMAMRSMGQFLSETYDKEMVVFGFATRTGTYTAISQGGGLTRDNVLAEPPEDSVEAVFGRAGLAMAILDIRGALASSDATAWAATARPMRSVGALAQEQQFFPVVARDCYDVLVWQGETTASRGVP
jgi:erythromycin esterase-like protein